MGVLPALEVWDPEPPELGQKPVRALTLLLMAEPPRCSLRRMSPGALVEPRPMDGEPGQRGRAEMREQMVSWWKGSSLLIPHLLKHSANLEDVLAFHLRTERESVMC